MAHGTVIATNGQTLTVNASVSHWTTEALAVTASGTNDVESTTTTTITSDYTLWFANTATTATITVKQLDGTILYTGTLDVSPGVGTRRLAPVPDSYQRAAESFPRSLLMPSGAVAETWPRHSTPAGAAFATTSGQMWLSAIELHAGDVVTTGTVVSDSTAGSALTNQWFALYDSALGLIRQTADDTSTAWAANTAKTLTFSTPYTVTASGLHYFGIMVAASTVPTFENARIVANLSGLAPKISGTSTGSLTTTAPSTAGAISASTVHFYAYVS